MSFLRGVVLEFHSYFYAKAAMRISDSISIMKMWKTNVRIIELCSIYDVFYCRLIMSEHAHSCCYSLSVFLLLFNVLHSD